MDGEIASEHYAGVRYRQPDIARLYEPYVCVIASVYRHNPRDYDDEGRRIPCPRFGTVTCGEHIWIEPTLFEQFFDGRRIAPRHIMVEPRKAGAEVYDVFYAWDTDSVFRSIREGVEQREFTPIPIVRGDRPPLERVASRDVTDREAVENAYVRGDRVQRRALLEAALAHRDLDQVDLLRLALFGLDVELARLARQALAQSSSESAIDLIAEALRVPMEEGERAMLVAALDRLGQAFPRARTLAAVHRGLEGRSAAVDVATWSQALESGSTYEPGEYAAIAYQLESRADRSGERPDDPQVRLELAEAYLARAEAADASRKYTALLFEDARREALGAERLGASGWRVDSTVAVAAFRLGELDQAYRRAEAAMRHMPERPADATTMLVLALFAEGRQRAIARAVRAKESWPEEWLTDVQAAYAVLAKHPLGTDYQFAAHFDFLRSLGAGGRAAEVLEGGLARFPGSWILHDRLRARTLSEKGAEGLLAVYDQRLEREDADPQLQWFAGYAAIVAAEFHKRAGRDEQALAAYDRALEHYEQRIAASPETRDTADHYVALALAGRARIAMERGDLEKALEGVLASFARREASAASLDGLNLSPVDTAKMLRARLEERELGELAAKLQAALGALDPALLELPAYERELPPAGQRAPRRRGPSDR
jgi:hypothetical protein